MSSAGLSALGRVASVTRRALCSATPLWPTTYKLVLPGNVSPQVSVSAIPPNVALPPYAASGMPPAIGRTASPEVKSDETLARMRRTARLAAKVLRAAGESLRVGMTTDELDRLVHDMCMENDAYPSPLNYRGFPKSVCTSVSNCACHGN
jgi:methionyl aminopeptidase